MTDRHGNREGRNGATSDLACAYCGVGIYSYRNHLPCPEQPGGDDGRE